MNSLTSLKSLDNYNKEVNDAFLMNNNNSLKIFSEPKEYGQESISSFDVKESINSSIGGENLSQLYSSLKKDYDILYKKYNELLNTNQEQKQKLEELNSKINIFQKEKENLLQEVDKAITEKLKLQSDLEIKKQNLELKEFSIKKLKNKTNDENGGLIEMEKIIQEKNEEIKKLKEKINLLEQKNGNIELNDENENKKIIKELENKIKNINNFYEDEINKLKDESQKEKDKYTLIIKVKDDEIQRLVKNKEEIKAQENKKYEEIIAKYEQIAKDKDTEIELLKLKNKKLSMINKMMQSKQENAKK